MSAAGRDRALFAAAALFGGSVWIVCAGGARAFDAFDAPAYWALGVPAVAVASAALGYAGARSAWRWPFVIHGAEFLAALIGRGGDVGNLFPLTIVLFAALASANLVPTYVGVGIRRLVEARRQQRADELERGREFAHEAAPGAPKPPSAGAGTGERPPTSGPFDPS